MSKYKRIPKRLHKRPGRPPTGVTPLVSMRLPVDLVSRLDQRAAENGSNRTALVIAAVEKYLSETDRNQVR